MDFYGFQWSSMEITAIKWTNMPKDTPWVSKSATRDDDVRWPISRVLCAKRDGHSSRTAITGGLMQPTRTTAWKYAWQSLSSLLGLAPGGVYHARAITGSAVRSYRTLSPLPRMRGGLLSVALSLRFPSPGVTRHRISMEPGLSSAGEPTATIQPPDHVFISKAYCCRQGLPPNAFQTGPGAPNGGP